MQSPLLCLSEWFVGVNLVTAFYMVQWIALSAMMIVMNKVILSTWNFNYPFFLTGWHMFFASIMTQCLLRLYPKMFNGVVENKVSYRVMMKSFIPIALFYAMSLVLCNQAYRYLSVSYIQMLKAFTPVYVLGIGVIGGLEKPSMLQLSVVFMICFGVSLSSFGEMEFVLIGFIFQMCGGLSESIRLVLQDKMLRDIKLDSLSTVYYLAPPSFLFIAVGFYIFEYSSFRTDLFTPRFTICLVINGFMAFFLNIAVVLLIKNTSSLTFSITGLFKDILLVTFSVLVFRNPITNLQLFGYIISLASLNMYKDIKSNPEKFSENCINMYNRVLGYIVNIVPKKKWSQFDRKEVPIVYGEADELIGEGISG